MKTKLLISFSVCLLVFFYTFYVCFEEKDLFSKGKIRMQEPFETLLGKKTPAWKQMKNKQDFQDLEFYKRIYDENLNLQYEPESSFRIPKKIHTIWIGPRPFPATSVEHMRTWVSAHPDWTFCFWTDRERIPPCPGMEVRLIKDFNFESLKEQYAKGVDWGEKADLLMYEILHQEGGVCIDHDANCIRPFHGLHKAYDFYAALEAPHAALDNLAVTVGSGIMAPNPHSGLDNLALTVGLGVVGSKPGHPIIKKTIQNVLDRWDLITEKFGGKGIQEGINLHRTYLCLTLALKENPTLLKKRGIVLPASYFYPRGNLPAFYSQHFYAGAWVESYGTQGEKQLVKQMDLIKSRSRKTKWSTIITLCVLMGCFALYLRLEKRLKFHLPFD